MNKGELKQIWKIMWRDDIKPSLIPALLVLLVILVIGVAGYFIYISL